MTRLFYLLLAAPLSTRRRRQAGMHERTLRRRLADPDFRRRIQAIRADMVQRHAGTLTAAGTEAVRALLELLKGNTPPAVRLGAARSVLEIAVKYREISDLEERLATIEEQLAASAAND